MTMYFLIFLALVFFDRAILRRKKIKTISVKRASSSEKAIRFELSFHTIGYRLHGAQVDYSLRDKNQPKTVIKGKSRTLDFSAVGANNEYLEINKHQIATAGQWELYIKVIYGYSMWNPLYKIFPLTYTKSLAVRINPEDLTHG
ncbi:MAG TPA: hypothetical protein VGL07_16690 [Buttiauxella sp.]|jgi:hypothetical protein